MLRQRLPLCIAQAASESVYSRGLRHSKPSKREVAVSGTKDKAVLDGECGKVRVGHEIGPAFHACHEGRVVVGPAKDAQRLQLENGHFHGTGDGRHPAVVAGQRERLALAAQVLARCQVQRVECTDG